MVASRLTWARLLPIHYASLGANDAQIGTAFSLAAAALALFQLLGGVLADRIGRKPVAVLPIFGVGLAVAWMARSGDWRELLAGHLILAAFAATQSPGFTTLLAESVPIEERGRAFGLISVASHFANAAGPALGAWLLTFTTLPSLLWGTAGVGVAVSLSRLLLLRETLEKSSRSTPRGWREANWRAVGPFLIVGALYVTFNNLLRGGPFISLHARQALGLDDVQLNLLFAAGDGVAIGAALAGGWMADRLGHRFAFTLGIAIQATGILAWSLLPPATASVGFFLLGMSGGPIAYVTYRALLTGAVESRQRGAFVGLVGVLTGLLGSPASRVGAELRAWFGSSAPFWAALGLAGALALILAMDARCCRKSGPANGGRNLSF
jgi:MFS family permease